jgi:hypothetical protein
MTDRFRSISYNNGYLSHPPGKKKYKSTVPGKERKCSQTNVARIA